MNNRMRQRIKFYFKMSARHYYLDDVVYDPDTKKWRDLDQIVWTKIMLPPSEACEYLLKRLYRHTKETIDD